MPKAVGSKTSKKNKCRWRAVKDFPNYLVSDMGDVIVKSTQHKLAKPIKGKYYCAQLSKNGTSIHKKIHILVARAFIKNPLKLPQVDHKDGNRLNNKVSNLRWFTQVDNSLSYHRNFRVYIPIIQYDEHGNILRKWKNTNEIIENNTEYKNRNINENLRGKTKSAYGYVWKYETPKKKKIIKLKKDEIFKNIGTFDGNDLSTYEISNYGTVRNSRNMILSTPLNDDGYAVVGLTNKDGYRKGYRVHQLVAHTFISDKIREDDVVNHLDENRNNNYYKNLEWSTQHNNVIYSIGRPMKMIDMETNQILIIFRSVRQAATYFARVSTSSMRRCCRGEVPETHGFKWEYLKENETLDDFKNDVFVYDLDD